MKNFTTSILILFAIVQMQSQENNVFTKTVQLESLIPFIVDNYKQDEESIQTQNITFLIPVSEYGLSEDALFILNQSFKLLSTRLSENDLISIVVYSGINGQVLKSTSPLEMKKVLYAINNIEKSIPKLFEDGIQLAYDIADDNFDEEAINSIVMIRPSKEFEMTQPLNQNISPKKEKNNLWLLTLLSLTPEIINAIND
jgi:hypothetical protein